MLLYEHILAPSRSKNVWVLLVLHVGTMLLAYPYDREFVSFRLHALVLVLAVALQYKEWPPAQKPRNLFAVAAMLNSTASLCMHVEHPQDSALYYHFSFVLLLTALVVMLYTV
jgi:hypothetical protein